MILRPIGWARAVRGSIEEPEAEGRCGHKVNISGRKCDQPATFRIWAIGARTGQPIHPLDSCDLHLPSRCQEAAKEEDMVPAEPRKVKA